MKLIVRLPIFMYILLYFFVLLLPYSSMDVYISKVVIALGSLFLLILICTFYIVLGFNKKFKYAKKIAYLNVATMISGIIVCIFSGEVIYEKSGSKLALLLFVTVLCIITLVLNKVMLKIIVDNHQFIYCGIDVDHTCQLKETTYSFTVKLTIDLSFFWQGTTDY